MKLQRFNTFINEGRSATTNLINVFKKNLVSVGMKAKENDEFIIISEAGEEMADMRIVSDDEFASVDMIEVYKQKKGTGTKIYQALLDAAINTGLKGIYSTAFDSLSGTGQQRSPGATALLLKLAKNNGGKITTVTPDKDDIKDLKTDGAPFYGPPYYDIMVNKSNKVKRF